jgi:cellulose synthase/poly-beta-1,6-N-acetylglucosamine synthase-like glycosyltransferase
MAPFFIKKRAISHPILPHRYAVLISARDEETVISQLLLSIQAQDYPQELITVFVAADNCADGTARVARSLGAVVWERFDRKKIGKGYALDFLFTRIFETYSASYFDGFFVFDADNLLDEGFISAMNRTFSQGHTVVTSYRNSKNYGANWISAGYSLWFLRESQYLNNARMLLGTGCAISGTGFLLSGETVAKNGGWRFFLLTEDIEFSVHSAISGARIAFCRDAVLYDEQPTTFRQSWNQRLRWARGFYQVFARYGARLFTAAVKRRSATCFDMLMTILPAILLTLLSVAGNLAAAAAGLVLGMDVTVVARSFLGTLLKAYLLLFLAGGVTVVTEWRRIHAAPRAKILYAFTFPLFMLTYIPIAFAALIRRVEWTPTRHTHAKNLAEVRGGVRGGR